jgi:cytochrome c553
MCRRLLAACAAVALLGPSVVQAQRGDAAAGETKASQCAGCHGIPGWRNAYPAYRVPKLGGQHAEYIVAALKAYQSGNRAHASMQGIAASLSDQDMADIAAFLSAPPPR